jgi:hypothetical protein
MIRGIRRKKSKPLKNILNKWKKCLENGKILAENLNKYGQYHCGLSKNYYYKSKEALYNVLLMAEGIKRCIAQYGFMILPLPVQRLNF